MGATHHGTPGGSLEDDGEAKFGSDARVGAEFERQVARAIHQWLGGAVTGTVDVFHDLRGLDTTNAAGRRMHLGTANVDHVILTRAGWFMIDAKCIGAGQLRMENGNGVLVTPSGARREQPWLTDKRAYSRAGVLHDLTGMPGVAVWVVTDSTDYASHPSMARPPCLPDAAQGYILSIGELAAGELRQAEELPPPYTPASPRIVHRLRQHIHE